MRTSRKVSKFTELYGALFSKEVIDIGLRGVKILFIKLGGKLYELYST